MDITQKSAPANVVLIGMAGAGKSTVGKELARLLNLQFVDVDTVIERNQDTTLQELLHGLGVHGFRRLEEEILLSLDYHNHVIATGGSAIYSNAGMEHLKENAILVLLDVSFDLLEQRVGDFSARGLVKSSNQSFKQLFAERQPLYEKHADLTIECTDRSVSDICVSIKNQVSDTFYHF
jgi:shikimate kinase